MLNDAAVSHFKKVYLAPGYTDLRRGIDGFASIVRFQFELDPYDKNTLFLFCGRKKAAGSRHQINCLILLMSVHSRFVCTVFQICSFIVINKYGLGDSVLPLLSALTYTRINGPGTYSYVIASFPSRSINGTGLYVPTKFA